MIQEVTNPRFLSGFDLAADIGLPAVADFEEPSYTLYPLDEDIETETGETYKIREIVNIEDFHHVIIDVILTWGA